MSFKPIPGYFSLSNSIESRALDGYAPEIDAELVLANDAGKRFDLSSAYFHEFSSIKEG
jgi:hypothetical protein